MNLKFDEINKENPVQFQFINGLYNMEYDRVGNRWFWTQQSITGIVVNVQTFTLTFMSEIENILNFKTFKIDIKKDCLNIVKLDTSDIINFNIYLDKSYKTDSDIRELGIKILSIKVNNDIIF